MRGRNSGLFLISIFLVFLMSPGIAFADKASVSIEAPASVPKGSEITIRFTITHSANSFFHYVEWVKVMINNKEFSRWDYSALKRPEGATFTREIKYTINENAEIKAEASCNIHGSKGPATAKVSMKE